MKNILSSIPYLLISIELQFKPWWKLLVCFLSIYLICIYRYICMYFSVGFLSCNLIANTRISVAVCTFQNIYTLSSIFLARCNCDFVLKCKQSCTCMWFYVVAWNEIKFSVSMLVRWQEFVIHMNKTFIFYSSWLWKCPIIGSAIACLLSICDKLRGHY